MNNLSAVGVQLAPISSRYGIEFNFDAKHDQQEFLGKAGTRSALVVDDAPDIALMLAFYLKRAGYRVVPVYSSIEALDAARSEHFDLVISDIGLPIMDGYELVRKLRALEDYLATPMIAVTGFSEYHDQQKALNAGFNAHVRKPVDPTKLVELVEQLEAGSLH
jgi:two-component system CheB/CheR fusion protein